MNKLSIIFVTPYGNGKGSMGKYTYKMIKELNKFYIICNIHEVKVTGVSYMKRILLPLFDSWKLLFCKEKIIYVQYAFFLNFIFLLPFLFISRFLLRKKIILHIHEYWKFLPFKNIVRFFDILYCFVANEIIVHNKDQYLILKKYGFIKIHLLYMPVDSHINPVNYPINNKINILMHGGIIRKKGFDLGIKALKLLPEKYNLTIVGGTWDLKYFNELLYSIKQLGLKNRINFVNISLPDNEYENYIYNSNIIIYPYTIATASAALADGALKFKKPFITSDIDSFTSYLGTNIFSFKNGDYVDLSEKVLNLNFDKSSDFCKKIQKVHSWKNMGKKLFNIISTIK